MTRARPKSPRGPVRRAVKPAPRRSKRATGTRYRADLPGRRARPGQLPRPKRDRVGRLELLERYRRGASAKGKVLDEVRAMAAIDALWRILAARNQMPASAVADKRRWRALRSQAIRNARHRFVLDGAVLATPHGKRLRAELLRDPGGRGRKSNRRLPAAVILRNVCETIPVNYTRALEDFQIDIPALAMAYGFPPAMNYASGRPVPRSRSGVLEAINGRTRKDGSRQDGIMDRVDSLVAKREVPRSWCSLARLRVDPGDPDSPRRFPRMGRVMTIDGTFIPIHAEQRQSFSREHEAELNGRFSDDEVGLGNHGGTSCRGVLAVTMSSTGYPLAPAHVEVLAANGFEPDPVLELVRAHHRWAGDLFYDLEYLVADSLYMQEDLSEALLFQWGIQLITPWHGHYKRGEWADNMGVPYCSCSGTRKDMLMVRASNFYSPRRRLELGLAPGADLREHLPVSQWPRIEWRCTGRCAKKVQTYPHKGAHLYPKLPFKDVHLPGNRARGRYYQRRAMMPTRNSSESYNSTLKRGGLGLTGDGVAAGISTANQLRWYLAARSAAINLKTLVQFNGDLDRMLKRMEEVGAFDVKTRSWYRKHKRARRSGT